MKPTFLCSDFFLDILYPNRCPACDRVISWNECLCTECEKELPYIEDIPWQSLFPAQIHGDPPHFDYANALFWYEGTAKSAVLSLKSKNGVNFAKFAADKLVLKIEADEIDDIGLVTAVPMYRRKKARRGYNQAEILAEYVSELIGKPCDFDLLKHLPSFAAQHELSGNERQTEARSVYQRNEKRTLSGENVLLCDDIFTTGATVNVCSELLKKLGAGKVYVVALCRTPERKK